MKTRWYAGDVNADGYDDVIVGGLHSGLGPYQPRDGVPPFTLHVPMEQNFVPLPAHEVTAWIPGGSSQVEIGFGNSSLVPDPRDMIAGLPDCR